MVMATLTGQMSESVVLWDGVGIAAKRITKESIRIAIPGRKSVQSAARITSLVCPDLSDGKQLVVMPT